MLFISKNKFPPNIEPRLVTLVAVTLGFALIDDYTGVEQIAIGNWLALIGQVLVTNGDYQRVIEERIDGNIININSRQFKEGGSPFQDPRRDPHNKNFYQNLHRRDLAALQKAIERINEELEKIKKEL